MKSKLLPIIGIVMAVIFIFLGLGHKAQMAELETKGKSAAGEVVGSRIGSGSKNKKKYHLRVQWDDAGTPRSKEFQVKVDFYNSHISGSVITNKSATVRYLPGDTEKAILEGGSTGFGGMEWLGYGIGVASLIGGFFAFTRR